MSKRRVYSAAVAHCQLPEAATIEQAWNLITAQFTGNDGNSKNFLNASEISRTGFKTSRMEVTRGDIFQFKTIGSAGERTGHVEITDWVPMQYFAYDEIFYPVSEGDIRDYKVAENRMEFSLSKNELRINLRIARRNKGTISFLQGFSGKLKDAALNNLIYYMSVSSTTQLGKKAVSAKAEHFDAIIIERDDKYRVEF